ncbi:GEL complex subunit OPTI-like [Paramacrobiotus metropolitanus]|uniref:GEL complex subunit OPTI-like n=1 Tax=Paramacrobiotus metropolitanus TaxID=2943436 RepID=UPI002445BF36|nr:GEL complex subunit OPTI-like [Paramacrobiotus metropolitanus]
MENQTKRRKDEEPEVPSVWKRAFQRSAVWPDKDELLDVIYWLQQVLALCVGLGCGLVPVKGFVGFAIYAACSCLSVIWYSTNFQEVDLEDTFGDKTTVLKEGFPSSLATFLVTWIIVYTAMHAQ